MHSVLVTINFDLFGIRLSEELSAVAELTKQLIPVVDVLMKLEQYITSHFTMIHICTSVDSLPVAQRATLTAAVTLWLSGKTGFTHIRVDSAATLAFVLVLRLSLIQLCPKNLY